MKEQKTQIIENNLYWAKVKENAIIPTKTDENAGYDIYACFDEDYILIYPFETISVPTGVAVAVNKDYYLQVQERGSTGIRGLKYGAGVIDSGYRGEIFIVLTNTNSFPVYIKKIDNAIKYEFPDAVFYPYEKAIAQIVVHKVPKMNVHEVSYKELLNFESDRKTGVLGSSGK